MNKYLVKIAEKKEYSPGQKALAIGSGVAAGTEILGKGLMANFKDTTKKVDKSLIKSYIYEHNLKGKVGLNSSNDKILRKYNNQSFFAPDYSKFGPHIIKGSDMPHLKNPKKYIINSAGSKDSGILLHELGHANFREKIDKSRITKAILSAGRTASKASIFIAPATYFGVKNSDSDTTAKVVAGAGIASQVPTLVDEAAASGSALKHIIKKRGLQKAIKPGLRMGGAMGTYLGVASLPVIAAHYANKARKERLKHE